MRRLLWKEWRENQWKLGFCVGVSLAFTTLLFRLRIFPDLQNAFFISLVQTIVVPVVFALDLFSGEMSNRTIHLLFKIPVPRWKIFFAKYLVATVGIALSFLVTATAMEALAWGREA
jgi:ABC-type transport system involved in multi-copper enzyme maturation permease subunit